MNELMKMTEDVRIDNETRLEQTKKKNMKERLLRSLLTTEARQRLTNIRLVNPELANLAENYVIKIASDLDIKRFITDDELKGILREIQQPKREFKIRWM